MAREALRRNLVVGWTVRGPDHEATIRFCAEAPRRRVHSGYGFKAMAVSAAVAKAKVAESGVAEFISALFRPDGPG